MKEIGGYLQLDQLLNRPYHQEMIELNSGRNALIYLIQAKNIKKIYIPRYLCDSVSDALDRHFVEYEYYNINENFHPKFDKQLKYDEYLYLVNYYGQLNKERTLALKESYKNLILDNTQAFFQKPFEDIDTIYSCRKYFGVADGAYLATNLKRNESLPDDQSAKRMKHILGRYEGPASDYYEDFKDNDLLLKSLPIRSMSKLTKNILGAIDYEKVVEARNENFAYLSERLDPGNRLKLLKIEGAFSYPYYVDNGIEIRGKLALRKIYIPTLWPNVLKDNDEQSIEYKYAANVLPLPCDQRYDCEDMETIVKELTLCIG